MSEKDHFYLDKIFPEADKIFSFEYSDLKQVAKKCIFLFDTNVLFVPFDASENSIVEIKTIFKKLKEKNRLFLPARVAREFANNRAKRISELFLKIRQTKDNLNSGNFKLEEYPLLEGNESYSKVKEIFSQISVLLKESRKEFEKIETDIKNWTWNDSVSKMYKEIFTPEIIIEVRKPKEEIIEDLKFRIEYKVAPGYKDSGKIDDGIGDLVIWTTVLELGKDKNTDVVFVTNEQKNDWFYKQDKVGLYPKYELFDEFRRFTNGKTIHLMSFPQFLEIQNAKEETVNEIKETIERTVSGVTFSRNYTHNDLVEGLQVIHKRFGLGVIVKLYMSSANREWVLIKFDNGIVKHFILKYCDLNVPNNTYNFLLRNEGFDGDEKSYQLLDEPEE